MDDRRTALAIFLSILVVMFYYQLVLAPKARHAAPQTVAAQSGASQTTSPVQAVTSQPQSITASPGASAPQVPQLSHPSHAELEASPATVVASSEANITISHLGARIRSFKLLSFEDHLGASDPVDMVSHVEGGPLPGGVYAGTLSDDRVAYTLEHVSEGAHAVGSIYERLVGTELSLTFVGTLPNGPQIRKTYIFGPGPYSLKIKVELDRPVADLSRLWVEWSLHLTEVKSRNKLNPNGFVLLNDKDEINHVVLTDVPAAPTEKGTNQWVALSDKYFIAALMPTLSEQNTRIGHENEVYYARVSGTGTSGEFNLYVGPKTPALLTPVGRKLERTIDLGWFTVIAYPLLSIIRVFYGIFGNYGLAIILLTLLLKTLFLPLTKASFDSMLKMQEVQPEMKALRERIKDATELNRAVMELYKKRGINPLGGCLPMLIQLPVFLGLYNALLNSIDLRHAPFALWIKDLSTPEHLEIFGFGVPIMVLLMGASMLLQQKLTPQTGDPEQQKVLKFMPYIFTLMFIIVPMPAGLVLYWLTNNTISIIQQVVLRSDKKANPYSVTAIASLCIFGVGKVLTLL